MFQKTIHSLCTHVRGGDGRHFKGRAGGLVHPLGGRMLDCRQKGGKELSEGQKGNQASAKCRGGAVSKRIIL